MASANTANTHKVSLIVSEQLPDFILRDHPKFAIFLEKYYEFMEQYGTVSGLPSALTASKKMLDYRDPDFTDFNLFLDSIRKEFSPTLPVSLANENINRRTLYKNLLDLYRAKGTEDSFKLLFRLLYNEEIELYYPKNDMLIASAGQWISQKKMLVVAPSNSSIFVNRKITGANSGATAIVERAEILTKTFVDTTNSAIFNAEYLNNELVSKATLYLNSDSMTGVFDIHEEIFTGSADGQTNVVTTVLPIVSNTVFFDDFSTYPNSMYFNAPDSNMGEYSSLSFNAPWGPAGLNVNTISHPIPSWLEGNTGPWFNHLGNGEVQFVGAENVSGNKVLQIGNNYAPDTSYVHEGEDWDNLWLSYNQNIPFDSTKLYRMRVRARDFSAHGNTNVHLYPDAAWNATNGATDEVVLRRTTNYWGLLGVQGNGVRPAGYKADYNSDLGRVTADGTTTDDMAYDYFGRHYFLLSGWALAPDWFVYESYIQGKAPKGEKGTYSGSEGGGTVRGMAYGKDSGGAYRGITAPAILNHYVEYMRPHLFVNNNGGGDITQIDYVKIEEISSVADAGEYVEDIGKLSTKSAQIQDNIYRQIYAYEIKSKKELAKYKGIVAEAVHPAGTRMFGAKISESSVNVYGINLMPIGISTWDSDASEYDLIRENTDGRSKLSTKQYAITTTTLADLEISDADSYVGGKSLKVSRGSGIGLREVLFANTDTAHQLSHFYGSGAPTTKHKPSFIDYGIELSPGKKWTYSAYVKSTIGTSPEVKLVAYVADTNADVHASYQINSVSSHTLTPDTWNRVSLVIDLTSNENSNNSVILGAAFELHQDNADDYFIDALQLEEGELATSYMQPRRGIRGGIRVAKNNLTDTFSPDQLDSLASWWKADALTAENLQFADNFDDDPSVRGTHATKNWMALGFANWEGSPDVSGAFAGFSIDTNSKDAYFGNESLEVIFAANQAGLSYGSVFPPGSWYGLANQSMSTTILPAKKKWVFSAFVKMNDVNPYVHIGGRSDSISIGLIPANNYGWLYATAPNPTPIGCAVPKPSANNTWERIQGNQLLDASDFDETKFGWRWVFFGTVGDGSDPSHYGTHMGTNNITTHTRVDGMMLEEYDPNIHGVSHPYTLSEYTPPSFNGANVMSWYDNSINQHHLYANTIALNDNNPNDAYVGGDDDIYNLRPPMYIANAVNGLPAIHMQSPTVNATYWSLQDGVLDGDSLDGAPRQHPANTYRWSPQPSDTVSGILMANTHLGDSSVLVRPVSNSWTVLCVAKTNLTSNSRNYTDALQTLIVSGHGQALGSPDVQSGGLDLSIGRTTGQDNGLLYTYSVNPTGTNRGNFATNGKPELVDFNQTTGKRMANTNEFNIIGYSQFSHNGYSTGTEALNFHINGLRFSNNTSDFSHSVNTWDSNQYNNLERDGFVESLQQGAVTSVGGQRRLQPNATPPFQGNFVYGLDGQIAEMIVFNEKLANNQIEKIEGYLAHKYGLTDRLYHRDGNAGGTHPYKTKKPPVVGD